MKIPSSALPAIIEAIHEHARSAAASGNHALARRLLAKVGVGYVKAGSN